MRIICVLLSHFIPLSDYQFKHKFLSIIFLRRGKKMSCYFYILCKYWRKHLRTALSLLFSGLLLTAIITSVFLFIREEINREVETGYDTFGKYDLILSGIPDDIKNELIPSDLTFTHETVTVPGKADFYGKEYNYGYTDKACNLLHVPMKNGSMPFFENEAAVEQSLLESVGYLGKTGDSITINGKQYILTGIIDKAYSERPLCEKAEYTDDDEIPPDPLPLIYVGKPSDTATTGYTIDLYGGGGITVKNKESGELSIFGISDREFVTLIEEKYSSQNGDDAYLHFYANNHEENITDEQHLINRNTLWLIIMSSICALIAVLSFICVLNIVFRERENTGRLLHNIGFSKTKSTIMYATEAVMLFVAQTVFGIALGILFYSVSYSVRTGIMGMSGYSAFTTDPIVLGATADPLIIAVIFSAITITLGYLVFIPITLSSKKQKKKRLLHCSNSAEGILSRSLGSKGITLIQTVALSLIVFGTVLGYMRYTRDGKVVMNWLLFDFPPTYTIGSLDSLDMEEDGIADYLSCPPITATSLGQDEAHNLKIANYGYTYGLSDNDTEKFTDALSFGYIENTFAVCDSETPAYKNSPETALQTDDDTIASVSELSDKEYKSFFGSDGIGGKFCYNIPIRLADEKTLNELSSYISGGLPDISALNSGEKVIMVQESGRNTYKVGDSIRIMGVTANDSNYGIGKVADHTFNIGATLTLNNLSDKTLRCLLDFGFQEKENSGCFLLTTAAGAASSGFSGAVYNSVYSSTDIDGGLVPPAAGMTRTNLGEMKRQETIDKFNRMSGTLATVLIMSLLGFAAYFSCIGLKIRMKSYEISVLRALGTPLSRIRRKLFISNLRIPVIATAFAGLAAYGVQLFTNRMYDKVDIMKEQLESGIADFDESAASDIINNCFLNDEFWMVPLIKPLVIIFIAISIITVILTVLSTKKFTSEISVQLNEERKRQ